MPSDAIDFRHRAELTEFMDGPCSRDQLRACLRDLARLNRWFLAYRPLLRWLDSWLATPDNRGEAWWTEFQADIQSHPVAFRPSQAG